MTEIAHNPKGLGWKKHGKNGRFVKRMYTTPELVSMFIGMCVVLSMFFTGYLVAANKFSCRVFVSPLPDTVNSKDAGNSGIIK